MPRVKLLKAELTAALDWIEEHGSSAFFPQPFEIAALRACWDKVQTVLERIELLSYSPKPAYELISPKQKYVVRPVHLIDPIDLILFTGLTLRLAPLIEARRTPANIVHSFRFQVDAAGKLSVISDWNGHINTIRKKTFEKKMAATADIVDFFPRIYLHRLQNALRSVTGADYETRAMMRLLEGWSHGTSYGIPVGPIASNLVAEALLVEVDEYLLSQYVDFVRFVDDYVIFGDSEADCMKCLFILGARLHQTQGLSLNMAKTRVIACSDLRKQLTDPEDTDQILRQKIIDRVFGGDPYTTIDYEKLTSGQKTLIDQFDARRSIDQALTGDVVDLVAVRFVLNVMSALRRPELIDPVLDNLARLLPVSDAVARFLNVFDQIPIGDRTKIGQRILSHIRHFGFVPDFQSLWLLEPFTKSEQWNNLNDLRLIAREQKNSFVRRQAVLALGKIGNRSALLDLKSSLDDTKDWEWRAIVYACRNLPKDERDAFYSSICSKTNWSVDNLTTNAVIHYAKGSI